MGTLQDDYSKLAAGFGLIGPHNLEVPFHLFIAMWPPDMDPKRAGRMPKICRNQMSACQGIRGYCCQGSNDQGARYGSEHSSVHFRLPALLLSVVGAAMVPCH